MDFDTSKLKENMALARQKLGPVLDKLRGGFSSFTAKSGDNLAHMLQPKAENPSESLSSLSRVLTGASGMLGEYYFPPELIGGTCPHLAGEEEELVWNAAAEACDSERVHVVWQSAGSKIWYLAVRSSELASHANTWCPFASVLPGMKDAQSPPVCYTHYTDESASMMLVTEDGLQIYRGTSLVVRAKAERSAREIGDAPIIELIPDKIMQLTPVPWYSLSLFEDRARRILAALSVFAALGVAAVAFVIWLLASMSLIASRHDLSATMARSEEKTLELMRISEKLRASPMREQLAAFAKLNDGLIAVDGLLQVYEIDGNKTRWRAIIPANITADRINALGGKSISVTSDGVAIGNAEEIQYEAAEEAKRR